ncbi:MAG: phosphatidylinositol-specific phospholipase C domain-containing protein [Candidatus Cryptobacteroides sp.]
MGQVFRTVFLYVTFLSAGLACCGCSEENLTEKKEDPPTVEGEVRFDCSIASSKAVFDGEDAWQLLWQAGDRVRIFCDQAQDAVEASYSVTPGNSATEGSLTASGKALEWNSAGGYHRFYAVYPESAANMAEEGVLAVPVKLLQKCTVKSSDATEKDMTAAPDMSQVYMVASAVEAPSEDGVSLVFKPLMTTLEIKVQGPRDAGVSRVTGLSVSTSVTTRSTAPQDRFYYDLSASEVIDLSGVYGPEKTSVQTIFLDLVDESGNLTYVDVGSGRTLTVTAFLPPVSQKAAASLKSRTTVRVHIASDTEVVQPLKTNNESSSEWTTRIPASSVYTVDLPPAVSGEESLGNNWLTPLPDDFPVCCLSLPGTHDAATLNCSAIGKCQVYTISEQLKRGVRVFDLRPTMDNDSSLGNIYHGILDTGVPMSSVFYDFNNYLSANPDEFIIVLMRYESDRNSVDVSCYNTAIRSFLNGNSAYQRRKAAFRPDLTVGDLRGKILIISRNDLTPDSSIETAYTGWSSSNVSGDVRTVRGTGGTADIYVQDMYSQERDGDSSDADFLAKKRTVVCEMMDIAGKFTSDPALRNTWLVNYTSAYVGTYSIFGYKIPNDNSYARNAESTNTAAYNYLVSREAAPTGIVMMDFAGASVYNVGGTDYNVCGDLLVQKIIDNNYRQ